MAEVLPEQVDSQSRGQSHVLSQQAPKESQDSDSKPLPKGVVLDKDGKPYVSQSQYSERTPD